VLRIKSRQDRRPTFAIESPLVFYPKYWAETALKMARWGWLAATHYRIGWRISRKGKAAMAAYSDTAMSRHIEEDVDTLDMFKTAEAKDFVAQQERLAKATKVGVKEAA